MFPEEQSIFVLSIAIDSKGKDMDKMMEHLKIYAPYYACFCHFRRTSEENEAWNEVLKDKTHWTIKEHLELTYCNT